MRKIFKNIKRFVIKVFVCAVSLFLTNTVVYGNSVQDSEIVSKLKTFIQDTTSTLMIVTPIIRRAGACNTRNNLYGKQFR